MARNGLFPPGDDAPRGAPRDAPRDAGESRFDAMLEERFSAEGRERFAREIASHDRARAPSAFDPGVIEKRLRYRGEIPDEVKTLLSGWIPGLVAHAAEQGLGLRDPHIDIEVFSRRAYEAAHKPIPAGVSLPASSYRFDPIPHRYSVSVVLPEKLSSTETMLTILRSVLARIFGDVFLREEIFSLEAYREDAEPEEADNTVGMAEQLALLAELPLDNPELESALSGYARNVGINYKKNPDAARKSFFKEAIADFERQRLPPERQALVESVVADYLATLRKDPGPELARLAEDVDQLNRQLTFLPPSDGPDYDTLRRNNPLHFLRSVKLRMEFLLEVLSGLMEDFEDMEAPGASFSPLAEERVGGNLALLAREGLARPYLVPGAQLSEELERKRNAFPFEVQALMSRSPPPDNPAKRFKTLRKKMENSLHQRLYHALVLLRQWIRQRESGRGEAFAKSAGHETLKGLVANFRFRRPLLESLFIRIGVVLDVAERQTAPGGVGGSGGRARFPTGAFSRAWGQFAAHALLSGYIAATNALGGFDPERYWEQVMAPHRERAAREDTGGETARLTVVLHALFSQAGGEGLPVLAEVLRQGAPSFRYAVGLALKPPPEGKTPAQWLERLAAAAGAVLKARESSLQYAIVVEGEPAGK
ncbi:MAG: hypothetical protein IIC13_15600 [SAR324 cluster bacterium]|nr:hypothetical protein [SAR324 cluster bacterium]